MRKIVRATVALTFAAGAVLATGAGSQAAETGAQAASVRGCASGAVCIYPGASWNGNKPSHSYYTYGAHDLVNQTGTHRIFNNQTGGAVVQLCKAYGGGQCGAKIPAGKSLDVNLTPINSIKLSKS
ncbi:hypothetical protein [Streptomyces sp. NPDC048565]|uniref:hypothetical protein n=1 Tax=Streptomyces sp. NPDC048565 TaxID=3155266 RepID=UPI00342A8F1A